MFVEKENESPEDSGRDYDGNVSPATLLEMKCPGSKSVVPPNRSGNITPRKATTELRLEL